MKWTLGLIFVASVATAMPQRDTKAFSLFSVVTFPNEECITMMTPAMSGICITAEECTNSGGTGSGNCASGFGVCCFRAVEGTGATATVAVDNDLTHIQNEGFPMPVGNVATTGTTAVPAATLMFPIRGDASICQIRLDFITAVFQAPTTANTGLASNGLCRGAGTTGDALTITTNPANRRVGFNELCGTLTGQHIYLDTNRLNPGLTVNILTGTNVFARTWKILVRRLRCDDPNLAPPGCRQFHTGLAGRITSLNGALAGNAQMLLRNLNYDICIRQGANICGLRLIEAGGMTDSFSLLTTAAAGQGGATGNSMTGSNGAGARSCQVEGLVIVNGLEAGLGTANAWPPVFCGGKLNDNNNQAVAGPATALDIFGGNSYAIRVVSDSTGATAGGATGSGTSTGFDLLYQQFC